jgi:hypothetical protein
VNTNVPAASTGRPTHFCQELGSKEFEGYVMICFYHLRLNLASIASVDLYRPYGPYGSWFLDLLVLLCLETQLAFVPNLDFGVSLTMHGIDEMP